MTAVGTRGRVSLKMGNGVAQAGYRPSMVRTVSVANAIAETVVSLFCFDQDLGLLSDGELRDRSIHFFFEFFLQVGHRQLRLWRGCFTVARHKLIRHPAEDVINDRRCVANLR